MNTDPTLVTITRKAHRRLLWDSRVLDYLSVMVPDQFNMAVGMATQPLAGETQDDTNPPD